MRTAWMLPLIVVGLTGAFPIIAGDEPPKEPLQVKFPSRACRRS